MGAITPLKYVNLVHCRLVLGKFSPRLIGTRSGLDQTQWSQSRSGIFPKTQDHLVSGLGNSIFPEMVPDRSGPGLLKLLKQCI